MKTTAVNISKLIPDKAGNVQSFGVMVLIIDRAAMSDTGNNINA